ncbi:MAG: DUF6753 family protein [Cyanobacteria bacterium J06635_15]
MLPNSDDQSRWLDKVLEGQSAEVKARVLAFFQHYGIEPDDEFYVVFAALGHLKVLIEDAPKKWQGLFEDFRNYLSEWSQQNTDTLEAIAEQAKSLKEIDRTLRKLMTLSSELSTTANDWQKGLKKLPASIERLGDQNAETVRHNLQIEHLLKQLRDEQRKTKSRGSVSGWLLALLLICGLGFVGVRQSQIMRVQAEQSDRLNWLIEKAIRSDCEQGLTSPDNLNC